MWNFVHIVDNTVFVIVQNITLEECEQLLNVVSYFCMASPL